jgi:photosystem II stability/assembly factor-like uncharacterized protein
VAAAVSDISTWGGRPRPRRTPDPAPANRQKGEADGGVGRGPGRPPYVVFALALGLGLLASLTTLSAADRWKIQYLYDQPGSNFDIRDIACPTAQRCIAAGVITDKNDRQRGAVVVSSDGGHTWSQLDVRDQPLSLFFLDETTGWMVTDHGLWSTVEGGRSWTRLEYRKGVLETHFLDAKHGYLLGASSMLDETTDGGKTWTKLALPNDVAGDGIAPRAVSYNSIAFQGPHGIIVGEIDPSVPAPKTPKGSARRPPPGRHVIVLETSDGGKNWSNSSVPIQASLGRLRLSKQGFVLALLVYTDAHAALASAVFQAALGEPEARMIFGQPDRAVADVELLDNKGAVIVAVEPPGKGPLVPIPGKLKILESPNLKLWQEMEVDYRALAQTAVVAVADPRHIWVATDTGAILGLVEAQ